MQVSLSELSQVKGIGKKTIERIKEYKNHKEELKQDRDVDLQVDKLETNVIHNKDNIKGMRQLIPNNSIDLTVTSPPYDNLIFDSNNGDYKPQVNIQDSVQTDPMELADSIKRLSDAMAMSVDTKVRKLHPNWTEDQIESEVERIMKENGMIVDEPDLRA